MESSVCLGSVLSGPMINVLSVWKISTFHSKDQHYKYQGSIITIHRISTTSSKTWYHEYVESVLSSLSPLSVVLVLYYYQFQRSVMPPPGTTTLSIKVHPVADIFVLKIELFRARAKCHWKFLLLFPLEALTILVAREVQTTHLFHVFKGYSD